MKENKEGRKVHGRALMQDSYGKGEYVYRFLVFFLLYPQGSGNEKNT